MKVILLDEKMTNFKMMFEFFFVTTYIYCVKWLPLDHSSNKICPFVTFHEWDSVSFTNVENAEM